MVIQGLKKLALYIHVPFCAKKCDYCNFISFCGADDKIEKYFKSVVKELEMYAPEFKKTHVVRTIYIGGGTPSYVDSKHISYLLDAVKKLFKVYHGVEVTIESNPNSLTEEKLIAYKEAGINRLSIGAQSCNDKLLTNINRAHNFEQFKTSLNLAKKYFNNINVDCMVGLPDQKLKDVKQMLKFLVKNNVKHFSVYSLIVEKGTVLADRISNGEVKLPDENDTVKMYDTATKFLRKHGIERYEVSNYSYPDYECKHNISYWIMREYLGVGVSSHSFVGDERFANTESLDNYLDELSKKRLPVVERETLTIQDKKDENIMLCLRTKKGLKISRFNREFNCNIVADKAKEIKELMSHKLIKLEGDYIKLADNGYYVLNNVIKKLVY